MLRFLVWCGSRVEDARKAKKIVCTTYTLLGSDWALYRPDWLGIFRVSRCADIVGDKGAS
jgi:hypothetical protein